MTKALFLTPPPGPLCWLHPEFNGIESQTPSMVSVQSIADLTPSKVVIPEGPRGNTLAQWLRQGLRKQGILVEMSLEQNHLERTLSQWSKSAEETVWRGAPAPLSIDQARKTKEDPFWLLPLKPGTDLESRLACYVKKIKEDPIPYQDAGLLPFFITSKPTEDNPASVQTRLLSSWWGILPGDFYPPNTRRLFNELLGLCQPQRLHYFRVLEHYALTGVDLYMESLMQRFFSEPMVSKKKKTPLILGVCGTDGAGKSSHVASLEAWLKDQGLKVARHKIYRHGVFHDTVTDLTRQCANNKNIHLWRMQRIIKVFDSIKYYYRAVKKDLKTHDVILFDRFTFTHFAAGAGRFHHDPFAREMLSIFPKSDRIYFLNAPIDEALRRIHTREEKTVDENPYMLKRYRHALKDLAQRFGFLAIDALMPFETNQRIILEDAAELLKENGLGERP